MTLSDDSQAILMLCSHLGLPPHPDPAPLGLREWNPLAQRLAGSLLKRPGAMIGLDASELASALDFESTEAERLHLLLSRGATLAIELERLESLGIWVLTRADDPYPTRLRDRLRASAPPVLFGAGPIRLAEQTGMAIVGSRDVDETVTEAAKWAGMACARSELNVVSGGARGVDGLAMGGALEAGGQAIGVVADSLERALRTPAHRQALAEETLLLLTPYHPKAGFSVGAAMGRNKLIYALSDYGLVIASDAESGGTWAGATEALTAGWVPVFACDGAGFPEGNRLLHRRGAIPFPMPFPQPPDTLSDWLRAQTHQPKQMTLF